MQLITVEMFYKCFYQECEKVFQKFQGVDVLTAQNKMFAEATRLAELCFISKSFQALEMFSWKILPLFREHLP